MANDSVAGQVQEIWRYPVKSMRGERMDAAHLTATGLLGDRGWATRDERRGGIRGAKKIRDLMLCAATYVAEPTPDSPTPHVVMTLPDGSAVRSDDSDAATRLSRAINHPVTLWPLQPADDLDHYRRGPADHEDVVEELRDIFGRGEDEPLPDLSGLPPVIFEFESPPGTYYDAYPVHIVTTATLRTLGRLGERDAPDVRRFRPTILVDTPDADGFPERDWIGLTVRVGEVEIEVVTDCPRCSMVQLPQQGLPADKPLLRTVVRDANQNVGVYCNVRTPGRISVGDSLTR